MSGFVAAMGAAVVTVGVGAVVVGRSWPLPRGRHRRPHPSATPALLRPAEALERFEAYCPAEDRPTLQLRLRLGGTVCTECRLTTTTEAP